jgi:hypothetical protein
MLHRAAELDMGPVVGSCEHDNVPSGSIKGGKILD